MVCVPCIVIPVLLWVFHKYIQPLVMKFWNPWAKKGLKTQQDDSSIDKSSKQYQYIQKQITDFPVMVFSKSTCPYCKMAKKCLNEIGVCYEVVEIEKRDDCAQLQDLFLALTGERTVPRVYIGGKCVGGGSDVFTLHNQGKLKTLCMEANAHFAKNK